MSGLIRVAFEEEAFDRVVLVGEPAGLYVGDLPEGTPVTWDKSNVLVASDLDALVHMKRTATRLRGLVTAPLSFMFERRVLKRTDFVWVSSPQERRRLHAFYGARRSDVLPSTVAIPPAQARTDLAGQTLLWMSTFNYAPNWDGLLRFLERNATALSRAGFRIRVVGASATREQIEYLSRYESVDFWGYVDDLADACSGVRLAVVPIWSGAGVKLKTLSLMALGVPVVATPGAMEGIPSYAAAAIVDHAEDFAPIIEGLSETELADSSGRALDMLRTSLSVDQFMARIRTAER